MPTEHAGHIIPSSISRDHILKAMHEIDQRGVPDRRKSTSYCLVHEQRHYPPKYVISAAARYAIGRELGPHEFYGGEGYGCANVFLRSRGFEIVECKCDKAFLAKTEAIETIGSVDEPKSGDSCCEDLFMEFVFEDLVEAKPPPEKGVYVIRIKNRSDSLPEAMISGAKQLIAKVGWTMLERKMVSRIERLRRIEACPTIYIGSAGTQRGSKNTLKGRYKEFSGRHTAMYPVWVLLYFGWKLELGWKKCSEPFLEEMKLKEKYQSAHQGRLPALVER